MRAPALTAILPLLLATWAGGACAVPQLYKSVGPDGRVVYSDRPPAEAQVEKTLEIKAPPSNSPPETASAVEQLRRPQAAKPAADALPAGETVLYSAKWCGFCRQAKAFLTSRGVAYREFDIETPAGGAAYARDGGHGVPLLVRGSARVQGFSLPTYEALFPRAN